jgi:hypothetical protein
MKLFSNCGLHPKGLPLVEKMGKDVLTGRVLWKGFSVLQGRIWKR